MTRIALPEQGLSHAIYISRAVPDPGVSAAATMQSILRVSIRNNTASGITGALLACDGWFLQMLEGEAGEIALVLERIQRDSRHDSIRMLAAGPIDHRHFGLWSMCASSLSPDDEAIVHVMSLTGGFDPLTIGADAALVMLMQVGLLQGSEAAHTRTRQHVED